MLTKWVVSTYERLIEIALWLFLIIGAVVGGKAGSPPLTGAIFGAAVAFLIMAVFLGAALQLTEISKRVAEIERQLKSKSQAPTHSQ